MPLREAVQMARQRFPRRREREVCLVISHAKRCRSTSERIAGAPEDALLCWWSRQAGDGP